jgi:hypothetical protein
MQNDLLPKTVDVCGREYLIRSDYRVILDICRVLDDTDYSQYDKALAVLVAFYPDISDIPQEHYKEALERCMWFIRCGDEEPDGKTLRLIDWDQDIRYIVSPINRVAGMEVRDVEYMHWWTFIGYFSEIGDCLFAQIVNVRQKLATGKTLNKDEREFYRKNRKLVDLKQRYTTQESELIRVWA